MLGTCWGQDRRTKCNLGLATLSSLGSVRVRHRIEPGWGRLLESYDSGFSQCLVLPSCCLPLPAPHPFHPKRKKKLMALAPSAPSWVLSSHEHTMQGWCHLRLDLFLCKVFVHFSEKWHLHSKWSGAAGHLCLIVPWIISIPILSWWHFLSWRLIRVACYFPVFSYCWAVSEQVVSSPDSPCLASLNRNAASYFCAEKPILLAVLAEKKTTCGKAEEDITKIVRLPFHGEGEAVTGIPLLQNGFSVSMVIMEACKRL